jgi:hypothetical protein
MVGLLVMVEFHSVSMQHKLAQSGCNLKVFEVDAGALSWVANTHR